MALSHEHLQSQFVILQGSLNMPISYYRWCNTIHLFSDSSIVKIGQS